MPSSSAPGPMIFVTASDTGVGKTLLTCLGLRSLRNRNQRPVGLKPFCSGSRADAQHLHRASGGPIDLEAINPWYYKTPIAPELRSIQPASSKSSDISKASGPASSKLSWKEQAAYSHPSGGPSIWETLSYITNPRCSASFRTNSEFSTKP